MKEQSEGSIGIVASGATRNDMTFFSAEGIRTDYVCVQSPSGARIVYEVLKETARNSRLNEADIVRFMESGDNFQSYNTYVGEAVPVACLNEAGRPYHDAYEIAAPGARVFRAAASELSQVFGVVPGDGKTRIGTLLRQHGVDVYLDLGQFLRDQAHLAVVGRTGSGKSWFIRHILPLLNMRCIVFSPTDEYDNLSMPRVNRYKQDTVLQLDSSFAKRIFNLNPSEAKHLQEYMKKAMGEQVYTADELVEDIVNYYGNATRPEARTEASQMSIFAAEATNPALSLPQYVKTLCRKLESEECLLKKGGDAVQEGGDSIIYNMQGCRRAEEERIIYNALFPLFEERKKRFKSENAVLRPEERIAIVLEEAQNYAPSTRSTICKDLLVDIARTGRKYGLHIILLSQRPRNIDQTILSQCGGGVFFHLPNPEDVDYVMNSTSLNRSAALKHMVQNFNTGECMLLRAERSCLDLMCKISSFS